MKEKKIVSIENRIPKLKQARKQKANRRLVFYLSIFLILISIIVYLQSPLSNIKEIKITGNTIISDEAIIDKVGLNKDTKIWTINSKKLNKKLKKNPIIKSVNVKRKLPSTILIKVNEYKVVGYVVTKEINKAVLENGTIVESEEDAFDLSTAPFLYEFKDKEVLNRMTKELNELPEYIFDLISEVRWTPSKNNEYKIEMYMVDGFIVNTTIRNFSENMKVYPSIVSQLDSKDEGIIHVGEGSYFENKTKK
ncbi:MAG TPA: FtsQ-type POTRA domain-containing protein [Pseudogracilibacillus sp.]|nr:FtsQ-type POTRA domain-containing protein [Pseudogracilibacillus sp.]